VSDPAGTGNLQAIGSGSGSPGYRFRRERTSVSGVGAALYEVIGLQQDGSASPGHFAVTTAAKDGQDRLLTVRLPFDKVAPCLLSPETDSPSPAQRLVRVGAQKANSCQFSYQ